MVSCSRLHRRSDGKPVYLSRKPWRDGTPGVVFTPDEFIEKLIALIPLPQANLLRYHGVPDIISGPTGSLQVDLNAIPVNPPQPALAGETWNFQCWFRDNNPALTSNFTDGLSVTFQ